MKTAKELEQMLYNAYEGFAFNNKDYPKIILLNYNDYKLLFRFFLGANHFGHFNNPDINKFKFMACDCVTWLPILKENEILIF